MLLLFLSIPTIFPEVLDEVAGGDFEQRRHVVVQGVHVLSQPAGGVILNLQT